MFYFFNQFYQLYDGSVRLLLVRVWRRFIDHAVPADRDQVLQSYKSGIKYIYWQIRKHTCKPQNDPGNLQMNKCFRTAATIRKRSKQKILHRLLKRTGCEGVCLRRKGKLNEAQITRYENLPFFSTEFNRSVILIST